METQENIRELIAPNDVMASIDLSEAFFSIPVHESSKKFLCFQFNNLRYVFNVLPFGLTSSPRIFSKVLKPVIMLLRSQGIKISFYLDDIFLCASSSCLLQLHVKETLNLLISLGFFPNYQKSQLTPSRSLLHLGYTWDSAAMTISLPEDKICKSQSFAKRLVSYPSTLREASSFLGLVVSHRAAFPFAPLHYRDLQLQIGNLLQLDTPWDCQITFNEDSLININWWASCPSMLPSSPIVPSEADLSLYTDASSTGWGGALSSGESVSGFWSKHESSLHINYLELKAIFLCISTFLSSLKSLSVRILSDNITAVSYVNKLGGTHSSELCHLSLDLWKMLILNHISCTAVHIPGKDNYLADSYSRSSKYIHDYGISQEAFNGLLAFLPFVPSMDLFASRLSAKLPVYVSWQTDPFSSFDNAFSISWPNNVYAFPPITLISKVIHKIVSERVNNILLITPAWPGLVCLPIILSLLIANPIFIPSSYLEGCLPTRHPFCLMAWPISTNAADSTLYLEILPSSLAVSRVGHYCHTSATGNNLVNLLLKKGIQIQFLSL
jgi:hypothetical protein